MIRILIVDDHYVVREGVKALFDAHPDKVIFGEASTPQEALKHMREDHWDIAVLDISIGDRNGLELLKDIKLLQPKLPVLILSMHSEEQFARRAFKAGAAGYITKDSPGTDLLAAIKKVLSGGRYVSAELAESLVVSLERDYDKPLHESLSNREFEVMCLIAKGKTVGEIAQLLMLSDKTISTYRARILEKMEMKTNAELTHYAIKNNIV